MTITCSHVRSLRAETIVSGDLDLLDLNDYPGIPIVKAAEAARRVEAEK